MKERQNAFTKEMFHILLVDDNPDMLLTLCMFLEHAGYTVASATDADQALQLTTGNDFHVAVVDYHLEGSRIDGSKLIAQLGQINPFTVCLLMTVYNRGEIGFQAKEAGAFNYLAKPFPNEVLSKAIQAALVERFRRERMHGCLHVGDIVVGLASRHVIVAGVSVSLTCQEFDLLVYMVSHPCRTVSYDELWKWVWDNDGPVDRKLIQRATNRLREKIGRDRIVCVRGKGYLLRELRP